MINTKLIAVGIISATIGGTFVWGVQHMDVRAANNSNFKMVMTGKDGAFTRFEDVEYKIVCYQNSDGYGSGCAKK